MSSSLARPRRRARGRPHWRAGRRGASVVLVGCALGVGCGTSRPPILTGNFAPEGDGGTGESGDAGAPVSLAEDAVAPPSCDAGTQGGVCGCLDLSLLSDPPNLFFVLDHSGSMADDGKWSTIRSVVAAIIQRIGPRARFGAAAFPAPNATDSCAAGVLVMPLAQGDAPAGTWGPTTSAFTFDTNFAAIGGTPTAATLTALTPTVTAFPGKTFLILATDGGPNCDSTVTCDPSACIPNIESDPGCAPDGGPNCCDGQPLNCLDSAATVKAVAALAEAGVPTYVIGVPGSGPYAAVLDQMAIAGGTARPTTPYYYAVDSTDTAAFTGTLSTVAAKITASCVLTLSQAPPDPAQLNVYLDGVVVPKDPTNGWTLSGATVTLEGTTCASVLAGNALDLRIVAGCPTVIQ